MGDVAPDRSAKRALRAEMRRRREALPGADRRAASARIEELVLSLPEVEGAGTVLLFSSFGSEVDTSAVADRLLAGGHRLLLPYLGTGGMEAAEVKPGDSLIPTSYGPKEPPGRVPVDPHEVDVVIAPGLAFDAGGRRLGYGRGHYDRYLARLSPKTPRIGIGFEVQLVERVPAGPGDERLDIVVTDAGLVRCSPPRRRPPAA